MEGWLLLEGLGKGWAEGWTDDNTAKQADVEWLLANTDELGNEWLWL